MIGKRIGKLLLVVTLAAGMTVPAWGVAATAEDAAAGSVAKSSPTITSDADTAAALGLLLGDGNGVNSDYLAKTSTRLQAAIISLRLQGYLQEALAYQAGDKANFTDAAQVNTTNQAVLAYLKNHPELGWAGMTDGSFEPLAEITSQQLYKVLLEVLGYKSGIDFEYADTESFAASKGLNQIAGTNTLTNAHIATGLVESLSAESSGGTSLFSRLQEQKVIPSNAALPEGERITLRTDAKLGTYFADREGRALYFFTKDAANLESCQGQCIHNWPLFYSDELQIPAQLDAGDFSVHTRANGTKQLTYKNWPLHYFAGDQAAGDTAGHNVNNVWFVIDPAKFTGMKADTAMTEAKSYTIEIKNFSFGTEPITVEAGSKITFTNLDAIEHNAVAVGGAFETPFLAKGDSFTISLDEPGTYDFFCAPHKEFMTGRIIVK